MTDLVFDIDNIQINLRAGGIIRASDQVLICRIPGVDTWYLPGGRITAGESSKAALARELSEEIEGEWSIHSPIASSENFFPRPTRSSDKTSLAKTVAKIMVQEFCTYYAVSWIGDPQDLKVLSHEEFRWINISEVSEYPIKPDFIKPLLLQPDTAMSHFIHQDA
jgi:8-oxo-dGTP pyrophosphatase MutT (NUDIX family)